MWNARFGRSERLAPSLRPLRSLAPAASLGRSGRSSRSLRALGSVAHRALRSLPPRAMALVLVLLARFARSQHSVLQPWPVSVARSEALCAPSPRALRSLDSRPPLPRSAASARSLRGLRSVARRSPRPPLARKNNLFTKRRRRPQGGQDAYERRVLQSLAWRNSRDSRAAVGKQPHSVRGKCRSSEKMQTMDIMT